MKRILNRFLVVVVSAIALSLCFFSILFWSDPVLQRAHIKWKRDKAALEKVLSNRGISLREISSIGYFTLKKLPGIQFYVPREYLIMPSQPNGETVALGLFFYFPGMQSVRTVQKKGLYNIYFPFGIGVFMTPLANYRPCWGNFCLSRKFALFQNEIKYFLQEPQFNSSFHQTLSLKNGQYDPILKLDMYQVRKKGNLCFDKFYLPPNSDSSNPGEWIHCNIYGCRQHWFRDGIKIEILFKEYLLSMHAEIRKKIDQKIEEYMEKTVVP